MYAKKAWPARESASLGSKSDAGFPVSPAPPESAWLEARRTGHPSPLDLLPPLFGEEAAKGLPIADGAVVVTPSIAGKRLTLSMASARKLTKLTARSSALKKFRFGKVPHK